MQTFKQKSPYPHFEARGGILHMNIFLFTALLLGGCNTNDPIATTPSVEVPIIYGDSVKIYKDDLKKTYKVLGNDKNLAIFGDTILTKKEAKLHTIPDKSDTDKLKKDKNKDLVYVSVGGSLTAGMRDGGLYREAQQTSFPNLLARQMKLKTFRQPLFSETEYNGYGYKVISKNNFTGTIVPKFNNVKNNLGIKGIEEFHDISYKDQIKRLPIFDKYKGQVDNYGVLIGTWDYYLKTDVDKQAFSRRFETVKENTSNSILEEITLRKDIDFFTLENGFDGFWGLAPVFYGENPFNFSATLELLKHFESIGAKGCVINIPDISDFPYFKMVSLADIKKASGLKTIYLETTSGYDFVREENTYFKPTATIDSLLNTKNKTSKKGESWTNPLPVDNILSPAQITSLRSATIRYNDYLSNEARIHGYPTVDINLLYQKILKGAYTTEDGVRIDPAYPNGNFFSSDGGLPTAFGHAVVANEVIKTLNSFYKTNIPLIPTKEYLEIKK